MADKQLTYSQQLALLPVSIPDSLLDFLEELSLGQSLQTELVREGMDSAYLLQEGERLRTELDGLKKELGKPMKLEVDIGSKEMPGVFFAKVDFEYGTMALAFVSSLKERTIQKLVFYKGEYSLESLKSLIK